MRHIAKMTRHEMEAMQIEVQDAAMKFAKKNDFSGLSHNGWFNFYHALQDAIEGEWSKAKKQPNAQAEAPPKAVASNVYPILVAELLKPTTPLPWTATTGHFQHITGDDLAYIVHACNVYPILVAELRRLWFAEAIK